VTGHVQDLTGFLLAHHFRCVKYNAELDTVFVYTRIGIKSYFWCHWLAG
jgi:hypothetical protein